MNLWFFRYLKLYQVIFLTMPQQLLLALSSKSIQNTKSLTTFTVSIMAQTITVFGLDHPVSLLYPCPSTLSLSQSNLKENAKKKH